MFTEGSLRQYPALVKALTGVPAEAFWPLVAQAEEDGVAARARRLQRPDRRRAPGGGRGERRPMAVRVAAVLAYLRLHVPQGVVGWLFGISQGEGSRELRAVLPLLPPALPCPAVWDALPEGQDCPTGTPLEQLAAGRVLIDATEQRVSRPGTTRRSGATTPARRSSTP